MRPICWLSISLLNLISIVALGTQHDSKADSSGFAKIQERQSITSRQDSASMESDNHYFLLLESFERFKAVWNQQPSNIIALKRYCTELQKYVTLLRGFSKIGEPTQVPGSSRNSSSTEAVVKPPSGPVQPSAKPSSEDEIRKREEATEKFLKGPLDDSLQSRTLAGIPDSWIVMSCNQAKNEITKICNLLKVEPLDHVTFKNALEQLRTVLNQINNPPSSAPPITPNGP